MRYDDILHETFITAINGIVANPAAQSINASEIVNQAWTLAVFAANKAYTAGPTLIPMVFNNSSVPSDPTVGAISDGSINNPNKGSITTRNPTSVLTPDGEYIPPTRT